MPKTIDVIDFATRTERLCDFLLDKVDIKDGSEDIVTIQKLKEDAADLQSNSENTYLFLEGLHVYVKGRN